MECQIQSHHKTEAILARESQGLERGVPLSAVLLIVIMLLAVALGGFFYTGFFASDDASYLLGIRAVCGEEELSATNLGAIRLGVTAPAALIYWLTGGNVPATIAFFLLYPPLMAVVAYLIGGKIHSTATGLVAAFLVATCPITYFFAGAILPDNPMSLWAGLSLFALVGGVMAGHAEDARPLRPAGWFLAAGFLLGLAYMVKETALVLTIPTALAFLIAGRKISLPRIVAFAAAFAIGLTAAGALEVVSHRLISGEWFWRPLTSQGESVTLAFKARTAEQGWGFLSRLRAVGVEFRPLMDAHALWGLGAIPVYLFLTRSDHGRRRAALLLLVVFVWMFLYLTYGSASLTQYQPPTIRARYYALCVIPGSVIVAQAVVWLAGRIAAIPWPRIAWRPAAALLAIGALTIWSWHFLGINYQRAGVNFRSQEVKAFLLALQDVREHYPNRPIVVSQYLTRQLAPIIRSAQSERFHLTYAGTEYADGKLPRGEFLLIAPANPNRADATLAALKQAAAEGAIRLDPAGLDAYAAPLGKLSELKYYLYPLFSSAEAPDYVPGHWWSMKAFLVSPIARTAGVSSAPAAWHAGHRRMPMSLWARTRMAAHSRITATPVASAAP